MRSEDGELVGEGGFKVDRARAVAKLKKFQLRSPDLFLLAWVRAANAAGAKVLRLKTSSEGLRISFDSASLPPAEADRYAALFAGLPAGDPRRLLAQAVLAAESLPASEVRVGRGRDASGARRLDVHLWVAPNLLRSCLRLVRERCACSKARILVDGEPFPRDGAGAFDFESGKIRGAMTLPDDLDRIASRVEVHSLGVRVETLDHPHALAPVDAVVEVDDLPLDASLARAVRGPELAAALDALDSSVYKFVERVMFEHNAAARGIGKALHAESERRRWRRAIARATVSEKFFSRLKRWWDRVPTPDDPQGTASAARRTRWLRRVAVARRSKSGWQRDPLLRKLDETGLWFSVDGWPLTLRRLREIAGRRGGVSYLDLWRGGKTAGPAFSTMIPHETVWIAHPAELEGLKVLFGDNRLRHWILHRR